MKPQAIRSLSWALVFQVAWIIVAAIFIIQGLPVQMTLLLSMIPILWIPLCVERLLGITMPLTLHVVFYSFISVSSIAGSVFRVYDMIADWDTIAHLYSGVMLAWFGFVLTQAMELRLKVKFPAWFGVMIAIMTALAFGALWEIGEYLSDRYIGSKTQFGLDDTMIDLIAALVGAAIASALAFVKLPANMLPRAFK